MILGFALKKISLKNMLNRGKEQLQHILIKFPVTHWLFSLLDCQIVILGKIFSVVNFGLCNNSAMVEKKLFEQCWRACTPFWTLISIISKDGTFQCSTLKLLRKGTAWHIVGPVVFHVLSVWSSLHYAWVEPQHTPLTFHHWEATLLLVAFVSMQIVRYQVLQWYLSCRWYY